MKNVYKNMRTVFVGITLLCLLVAPTGCATRPQRGFPPREQINNFDAVSSFVTRGAQPNAAGLKFLAGSGHTLVINLRQKKDVWADEETNCRLLGMHYINVPLSGTAAPALKDIWFIMDLIQAVKASGGKVFVHCEFGCDRTGVVIACWQITDGMLNQVALNDAMFHGMSKLLWGMHNFIRHYQAVP